VSTWGDHVVKIKKENNLSKVLWNNLYLLVCKI
jgi:hypothetical protein